MLETDKTFGFRPSGSLQRKLREIESAQKAREDRSADLRDEYIDLMGKTKTKNESNQVLLDALLETELLECDFSRISRAYSIKTSNPNLPTN